MHDPVLAGWCMVVTTKSMVETRVLQNTYPVRTKHCQYRLYCSDIVAYSCVIVETHSHCQLLPVHAVNLCARGYRNDLVATLP